MNINIDYDGTYTNNPDMWDEIIETMNKYGCKVYCITKRYGKLDERKPQVPTIHAMKSKLEASVASGINIDIWIDDKPQSITPYRLIKHKRYKY
jgi:hypothetical protein